MDFFFMASSFAKEVFYIFCDFYFLLVSVVLVTSHNFNEDTLLSA